MSGRSQRGFTLIELLIVVAIIGILAAVATPGLMRARMSGNESSAIGSLRAISSGEAAYASATGGGGYAVTLANLSTPCPGATVGFISPDLKTDPSVKSGYTVSLSDTTLAGAANVVSDCNGKTSRTGFYAKAIPLGLGTTGIRAFSTSSLHIIYVDATGAAPPEAGGVALQ